MGIVAERNEDDAWSKVTVGRVADWRAAGVSAKRLRMLTKSGELVRIRRGAYATREIVAKAEADPGLRHALEVVASGEIRDGKGVASHQSAARLWRLSLLDAPPDKPLTLTVPRGTRDGSYRRPGLVSHAAELPDDHVTERYGVPVTTAARTVIDIARSATFRAGVVVADSALHERHSSKTDLRRVLARCEGWPGVARARRAVDFASPLAESALESCARVAFHEQGLPAPMLQTHILGADGGVIGRVDFCWAKYRTIAEADGLLKYQGRQDAIAELKRDRLLREAGYEVVHFTWQELFGEPERIAERVRAGFRRAIRIGADPRADASDYGEGPTAVGEERGRGRAW
jgi:predicted transcriptional regulator of viral defense system